MLREIDKRIRRHLGVIRQAFRMVIGRVDSASAVQLVSGDAAAGESLRDAELMQHYGFTSHPPAGAMGVVVPVGGKTSHGIIVATEHARYRVLGLAEGDVAIYTDEGARIVLRRGRIIDVECDKFLLKCKEWRVDASVSAAFNTPSLAASGDVVADGVSLVEHTHTGDSGGITSRPRR